MSAPQSEEELTRKAELLGTECIVPLAQDLGLNKRELFAAMAMQGALGGTPGSHLAFEQLARESVMHADALLKELAK